MKNIGVVAAMLMGPAFAQGFPASAEFRSFLAIAEVAAAESAGVQPQAAVALQKLRETWDMASQAGLEVQVNQLQLRVRADRDASQGNRLATYAANAQSAWSGLVRSNDLGSAASGALTDLRAATARMVATAKGSVAAGSAKEELDSPGGLKLATAREAERRLMFARSERTTALGKARSLEGQLSRIRAAHQKAVADAVSGGGMSKAAEADRMAGELSQIAAAAAAAYAQAARHAADELQFARIMADAYADLGRDSVGSADLLQRRR